MDVFILPSLSDVVVWECILTNVILIHSKKYQHHVFPVIAAREGRGRVFASD